MRSALILCLCLARAAWPAQYVDFPWRPVNTIQETGLPDQNPVAGTFYDLSSPVRRQLYRLYIRKCLDVLGDNSNVVCGIDRKYTGPMEFVRFWLDTIALEIPKAQMDAPLAEPAYRPMIAAIGFHRWNYRADGRLFAIQGNVNLAPRQQETGILNEADWAEVHRQITDPAYLGPNITYANQTVPLVRKLRAGTPPMRCRALREYRDRYPELVVIGQADEYPELSRAIERNVPANVRAGIEPAPLVRNHPDTSWCMTAPGSTHLVYSISGKAVDLDLSSDRNTYSITWIDAAGSPQRGAQVRGGGTLRLAPPEAGHPWVAWLARAL